MLALRQTEEPRAQKRPPGEIERSPRLGLRDPPHLRLPRVGRKVPQVEPLERHLEARHDHLDRFAGMLDENGAQRLVAQDHRVEVVLQRRRIEPAAQAHGGRRIVERIPGLEATEEPEAPLREGKRQVSIPRQARDGARGCRRWRTAPARQGGEDLRLAPFHLAAQLRRQHPCRRAASQPVPVGGELHPEALQSLQEIGRAQNSASSRPWGGAGKGTPAAGSGLPGRSLPSS